MMVNDMKSVAALLVLCFLGTTASAATISRVEVAALEPSNAYQQACASCHMLYAPSMLPARSWQKMMSNLNNHFGDNAEVTAVVNAEVMAYLKRNAAENDKRRYAKSMLGLLKDEETPDYISDTKYFKLMHDAVKPRMVLGNPDVRSFARCEACHSQAQQGKFNRIEAIIPNYFRKAGRFVE